MSFDAIAWALAQPVGRSSAKFLLVAMADCVNGEGTENMLAYPSAAHLARCTEQDEKTVQTNLLRLREMGFIEDTGERKGQTGQVIVYRLKAPQSGSVATAKWVPKDPQISGERPPNLGQLGEGERPPNFRDNTPKFPPKDPQISGERPPNLGDGTSKEPVMEPIREPVRKRASAHRPSGITEIPGVSPQLLDDFLVIRKNKKVGPLTETALSGIAREAKEAGIDLTQALRVCCEAGWAGFKADWYSRRQSTAAWGGPRSSTLDRGGQFDPHRGFDTRSYEDRPDGKFPD